MHLVILFALVCLMTLTAVFGVKSGALIIGNHAQQVMFIPAVWCVVQKVNRFLLKLIDIYPVI